MEKHLTNVAIQVPRAEYGCDVPLFVYWPKARPFCASAVTTCGLGVSNVSYALHVSGSPRGNFSLLFNSVCRKCVCMLIEHLMENV